MRQSAGTSNFLVLKALAQSYALKGDKQKARECIVVAEDRQAESEKPELKNTLTRKLSQIGKFLGLASDAEPCRYGLLDPNEDHSN
jgi:hypothetical protein